MNRKELYDDKLQLDYFSDSYLRFESDFYKYSALDIPLTFITDDILRTMAMSQKHYFKLNKSKSLDNRDHYFVFSIKMNKDSSLFIKRGMDFIDVNPVFLSEGYTTR